MKHKTYNFSSKPIRSNNNQEQDAVVQDNTSLGYFTSVQPITTITVPIDEEVKAPSYYRHVIEAIEGLSESDQLIFNINSPGGRMDGLESLLAGIELFDGSSVAVIQGDCHSAASILAMSCDAVAVSKYANMLVHFVSFGTVGSASHIKAHVDHVQKISEKLFRETYKYFLTEEEIEQCIYQDRQLYLDADEIMQRLEQKIQIMQELEQEESEEDYCDECEDWECDCNNSCNYCEEQAEDCNCSEPCVEPSCIEVQEVDKVAVETASKRKKK